METTDNLFKAIQGKRATDKKRLAAIKLLWLGGSFESIPDYIKPSLASYKWIDSNGKLTPTGRGWALADCPFTEQCEELRIKVNKINLPREAKSVEEDAAAHYRSQGWDIQFDEGASIYNLYRICWRALCAQNDLWTQYTQARSDIRFTKSDLKTFLSLASTYANNIIDERIVSRDSLIDQMLKISLDKIQIAYSQWFADQSDMYTKMKRIPESFSFTCKLYQTLPQSALREIFTYYYFSEQPACSGYPDLTCISENEVKLIEIKTSDSLTRRQVERFPLISDTFGIDLSVTKVKRM